MDSPLLAPVPSRGLGSYDDHFDRLRTAAYLNDLSLAGRRAGGLGGRNARYDLTRTGRRREPRRGVDDIAEGR